MANRANTQMARSSRLSLAIRRERAVLLEHDLCHIMLIHGCPFLLLLSTGQYSQLNGQTPRRDGVVQHSGASEAPHSLQHRDHHASLVVPEQAYPVLVVGTTCRSGFPVESATVAGVHQELAPAPRLRVRPWPGERPHVCAAWFLPV